MKKNILRVLAGIMTVFMLFAMTACTAPAVHLQDEAEQPEVPALSEAEQAVAAYVEANKDQVSQLNTNETFHIDFEAQGTKVVYKYTYQQLDNLSDEQLIAMKKAFAEETEKNKETFKSTLETIKKEEPNVTAMVFEYYEKSGKFIDSIEIN